MQKLFAPYRLKTQMLRNRVVMPPVYVHDYGCEEGFITEKHIQHYSKIAEGEAGLIILESSCVDPQGRSMSKLPCIWDDHFIAGYEQLSSQLHALGSKVILQLFHAGFLTSISHTSTSDRVSSSAYSMVFKGQEVTGRPLTIPEIGEIKEHFVQAALRAEKAGLDGIELHAAHSYLLSQFLSPKINQRTDSYGGNIENRLRFPMEIYQAIRNEVSDHFIIGIRLGSNEPTLNNSIYLAKAFDQAGIDYISVSAGFDNIMPDDLPYPADEKIGWIAYSAGLIKKEVHTTIIAVNKIIKPDQATYIIDHNIADLVALARAHLCDPDWCKKARQHQSINLCRSCKNGCSWFKDASKCPALKKENKT